MIAQGQLEMFAQNIALILGTIVLIGICGIAAFAAWTGLRVVYGQAQQRRSWAAYLAERCRADGAPYPPFIEGTCGSCGRGDTKIYQPPTGQHLCPSCYEVFWRNVETAHTQGDVTSDDATTAEQPTTPTPPGTKQTTAKPV